MQTIVLKNILSCPLDAQMGLRDIRNHPNVRRYMYTDHEITASEHQGWLTGLAQSDAQRVFLVLRDGVCVGMVSVSGIDPTHRRADWAFYLDETARGGLGSALEFSFLSYVFDVLPVDKLNCEVLETNPAVIRLHQKFGFEVEGFRRNHIRRDDQVIGVQLLGITRGEWAAVKPEIAQTLSQKPSRFSVSIDEGA